MFSAVTSEFAIAVSSGSNGPAPVLTTLADGRVVATWFDIGSAGGDVRHRILDVDGDALTPELLSTASVTGQQTDPSVAALTGGGFVIVWESYVYGAPDGVDVHYCVFDGNGNAVATGLATSGESAALDQYDPAVIGTSDGGFVVAWGENNKDNANLATNNNGALVARAYSATGVASSEIVRITSNDSVDRSTAILPALDADANGVIYVWDDNEQNNIITRTFAEGVPAADQTGKGFSVSGNSDWESSTDPDVAITSLGTVFVWEDHETDNVNLHLDGITATIAGASRNIRVDALPLGGFVVVWEQFSSETSSDIMCLVYDRNGNTTTEFPVNLTEGQTGAQFAPDVTSLIDGRFMVTWSSQGDLGDVVGRIYDPRTEVVTWTGGSLGERFVGTDIDGAGDVLDGAGGDDRIWGQKGNDSIAGGEGSDTLDGGAGNDTLDGGAGNDRLTGGAGNDRMTGGAGDDTYFADAGDTIVEVAGEGTDTVFSTVSLTLAANVERLVVTGSANAVLTGNAGANILTGNGGANTINGGGGADTMAGGAGNDTYVTDGGDTITEGSNAGTDTVRSSVTLTLGANLENLVLTGSGNLNGTGNGLANAITGNGGANRLAGEGGNDRLDGGSGNDVLNGGTGADSLTGGAGRDVFVFNAAAVAGNADRITDFRVVDDTIHLENAVFAGLRAGALAASAFVKNTSGNAADASDRVIYESDTGKLFFDRDGTGAAGKVLVATLDKNLGMTAADVFVI